MRACTVHPRVCGEIAALEFIFGAFLGSPPRVRGNQTARLSIHLIHRFTPACAGKSDRRACAPHNRAVHPRVCGEIGQMLLLDPVIRGSPPRVRGNHVA